MTSIKDDDIFIADDKTSKKNINFGDFEKEFNRRGAKLREMVEMLPEIKEALVGYSMLQEDMNLTDTSLNPDSCERVYRRIIKWENE